MPKLTTTKIIYKPNLSSKQTDGRVNSFVQSVVQSVKTLVKRGLLMSTFTFNGTTVSIDPSYRALGGAMRGMAKNVLSFQVKKLAEGQWYLITNRQNFIGRYPSQSAAISVLYGIMTYNNGLDSGIEEWLNDSLSSGGSTIDPDVNILTLRRIDNAPNPDDIRINLFSYSEAALPEHTLYFILWQTKGPDGIEEVLNVSDLASVTKAAQITTAEGGTEAFTFNGAWDEVSENHSVRPVIVGVTGTDVTVLVTGSWLVKDDVDETDLSGLLLEISGSETAGDPVELGGYSYAIIDDSAAVLDPGESIFYTYMWYREIPTLTSLNATQS